MEGFDPEFVKSVVKAMGENTRKELEASIDQVVSLMALFTAEKTYQRVMPKYQYVQGDSSIKNDYQNYMKEFMSGNIQYDKNFQAFMDSYSKLVRDTIDEYSQLIHNRYQGKVSREDFSEDLHGNILTALGMNNPAVQFNIGGKLYTIKGWQNLMLFG